MPQREKKNYVFKPGVFKPGIFKKDQPLGCCFSVLIMLTSTMSAENSRQQATVRAHAGGNGGRYLHAWPNGKLEVGIMTYGGIIVSLRTPDRNGKLDDIVLGCDSVEEYVAQTAHFGGISAATRTVSRMAASSSTARLIPFQRTMATTLFTGESADSTKWSGRPRKSPMESNLPM